MKNILKYIIIVGHFTGVILCIIGFLGIKKLEKEHKKISDDDYLLEHEKQIQNRNVRFLITGIVVNVITSVLTTIRIFFKHILLDFEGKMMLSDELCKIHTR